MPCKPLKPKRRKIGRIILIIVSLPVIVPMVLIGWALYVQGQRDKRHALLILEDLEWNNPIKEKYSDGHIVNS